MEVLQTKTLAQLACEMDAFFQCNKEYAVTVSHPLDGAVAVITIAGNHTDFPCKVCRIICSRTHNGCYTVYIPSDEIPYAEKIYLLSLSFTDIKKAYNFIVARAKQINEFFKH